MGVPEPVPIDARQLKFSASRLELAIEQIALTERGTVPSRGHQARWNRFG